MRFLIRTASHRIPGPSCGEKGEGIQARGIKASSDYSHAMPLPPDRSWVLTEQRNPRTAKLHQLSVGDCVRVINQEDRAVLDALDRARPAITAFIEAAEPGF